MPPVVTVLVDCVPLPVRGVRKFDVFEDLPLILDFEENGVLSSRMGDGVDDDLVPSPRLMPAPLKNNVIKTSQKRKN